MLQQTLNNFSFFILILTVPLPRQLVTTPVYVGFVLDSDNGTGFSPMSASLHHYSTLIQYSSFSDTMCPQKMAASFKKMPASFSSFPPSSLPFCSTAALMSHPGNVFHTHHFAATFLMFLISGLCPKAAVNCALQCYCAVSSSNFLLVF